MRIKMLATYQNYLVGQIYFVDEALGFVLLGNGKAELCPYGVVNISGTITRPSNTTDYSAGDAINSVAAQVKQKETLTITGESGSAVITCGGLTKTITFDTDINTTVAAFQTANVAAFLAAGIVLTNDGADIIFEAQTAGVPFTAPTITAGTSDVTGTVANTQANVAAVKQKEIITLTGTFGKCVVTGAGSLTKVGEFNATLDQTAADFVTAHAAAYLAQGIVLTASTDTLIFEASVAGVPFTAPTISFEVSDLAGSVLNVQANVVDTKKVDTITLTGTEGLLTIDDIPVQFDTSPTVTAAAFVTNHAASYLPTVVTSDAGDIIFTAGTAGVTFTSPVIKILAGDIAVAVEHTTANGVGVKQKETLTISGEGLASVTVAGGLTTYIQCGGDTGLAADDFVTANAAAYDAQGIAVTSYGSDIIFEAKVANTPFDAPVVTPLASDLNATLVNTTPNAVNTKQRDTIPLTGVRGYATVTLAGGLTKLLEFNTNLDTTASDFVTAFAADYAAQDIVLTSFESTLIFEAATAGTPFTSPEIATTESDLSGTVEHNTANVVAVKMKDTITVEGTFGNASITLAGGLTKILTFATSITASLQAFVTANAAAYLAQAIVLTSSGEDLIFEAQAAGTAFTSPVITTLTNVDGTVAHTTANVSFAPLEFANLVPISGGSGTITRIIARTTNVGFASKKIRLWLYNAIPTPIGDNLALNNPCDVTKNAFAVDLTFEALTIGTDTQVFAQADVDVDFLCVNKSLWGAVQALETMTPISAGVLILMLTAK